MHNKESLDAHIRYLRSACVRHGWWGARTADFSATTLPQVENAGSPGITPVIAVNEPQIDDSSRPSECE